jgi:CRP-like cAMP-binding protein
MQALGRLTDAQRDRLLELAEYVTAEAGSVIIEEDQRPAGIVLLLEGTVRIEKNHLGGRIPVDELSAGELLGEISYLLDSGATVSVVADDDVRLALISREVLDGLLDADPAFAGNLFRSWAEVLARRLDRRTGDVVGTYWTWG